MGYIGDVKDDMQILLNRKGLLLRQWAELHRSEFLKLLGDQESRNVKWGGAT